VTIAAAVAVTTGVAALLYAVATADLVTLTRSGGGNLIAGTFCCLLLTVAFAACAMYALRPHRRPPPRCPRQAPAWASAEATPPNRSDHGSGADTA
jgi:hypothetical protein